MVRNKIVLHSVDNLRRGLKVKQKRGPELSPRVAVGDLGHEFKDDVNDK